MFQAPFSSEGRIRRTEYALSYLAYMVFVFCAEMLASIMDSVTIALILYIPALWFMFVQGAKRCHDRGNSGWYQLIPFYQLVMLFGDSDEYGNEYGPNPKTGNAGMQDMKEKIMEESASSINVGEHIKEVVTTRYTYKCQEGELVIEQEYYQPNKGELAFLNGLKAPDGKYKVGFMNCITIENGRVKELTMF